MMPIVHVQTMNNRMSYRKIFYKVGGYLHTGAIKIYKEWCCRFADICDFNDKIIAMLFMHKLSIRIN